MSTALLGHQNVYPEGGEFEADLAKVEIRRCGLRGVRCGVVNAGKATLEQEARGVRSADAIRIEISLRLLGGIQPGLRPCSGPHLTQDSGESYVRGARGPEGIVDV